MVQGWQGAGEAARQQNNGAAGQYCNTVEECFRVALAAHHQGDPERAEEGYRRVLAMAPDHLGAAFHLGLILQAEGNPDEAVLCYRQVIDADPSCARAYCQLGLALADTGDGQAAIETLQTAVELAPQHLLSLRSLGVVCYGQGRYLEAVTWYERALAVDPVDGPSHYNLGVVLYRMGRLAEAAASYARAVQVNAEDFDAWYNLGIVFKAQGELEEAAACYQSAIDLRGDDADVHYNLGIVLKDLQRFDEAISSFRRALAVDPAFARAYNNLGILYHRLDRFEEARVCYRQAAALGHNPQATAHILAALAGTTTETAPAEYVRSLFDGYAERFDHSLLEELEYKTPMVLRQKLDTLRHGGDGLFDNALDLGCGTGLSGLPFRAMVRQLTGVDLSARMIAEAGKKEIYDRLRAGDILDFLKESGERFDLFVAADVLVYLGCLAPIFQAVRARARAGAYFLFSTESCTGGDYLLRSSGRYAHSLAYLRTLAADHGFSLLAGETAGIRKERGEWIMGNLCVLRLADAADDHLPKPQMG